MVGERQVALQRAAQVVVGEQVPLHARVAAQLVFQKVDPTAVQRVGYVMVAGNPIPMKGAE